VIPADQAPNTYPAYSDQPSADGSRAAFMVVNLYKPETRPKYEIPVLTCHEGRPGHALQLSLATELNDLPEFRRFGYFNVYGEGWALYSETLCGEMGVYNDAKTGQPDPYLEFGMLSYQMWRAVRLVVDTGIHDFGMSRDQAVQMFKDNTALTDQNIGTEVDRYIAWPGQALSYMVGEIKIQELRKRAEDRLGPKFDIRGFHDVILENGTVPLNVLEAIVDEWVDSRLNPVATPASTGPGIRG
jgi:prolyl oligopeptidase